MNPRPLKTALLLSLLLHLLLVSLPWEAASVAQTPEPRTPTLLLVSSAPDPAPPAFSVSSDVVLSAPAPVIPAAKRPGKASPQLRGFSQTATTPVPPTPHPRESPGTNEFFEHTEFTGELIEPRPLVWDDELEPPRELLGADWRGEVLLALYIDDAGTPRRVEVVESSGEPLADRDAVDYAYASRWRPATRDGVPIGREVRALIRYRVSRRVW